MKLTNYKAMILYFITSFFLNGFADSNIETNNDLKKSIAKRKEEKTLIDKADEVVIYKNNQLKRKENLTSSNKPKNPYEQDNEAINKRYGEELRRKQAPSYGDQLRKKETEWVNRATQSKQQPKHTPNNSGDGNSYRLTKPMNLF